MRKIVFVLAACFLAACSKDVQVSDAQVQKVTFSYRIATEVPMTKAVNNDAVIDWIAAQLPEVINIRLTDANGTRYNIQTGSEVQLPVGIYSVTGKYTPSASANVVGSDVYFSTSCPALVVNTSIEVTYTQKQYVIPATFGAFGIVIDTDETASATFQSSHGETGNVDFANVSGAGIVFVNGNLDTHIIYVTLNPANSSDEATTFTFKTAYSQTSISPTFGNYYILHPKSQSSVDGGTFSYAIGDFRAVDVE